MEAVPLTHLCNSRRRIEGVTEAPIIIGSMRSTSLKLVLVCVVAFGTTLAAAGQAPQSTATQNTVPQSTAPAGAALPAEMPPTEQQLGLPVLPGAQFLRSYDAGRGQRYYLFGTQTLLDEVVAYYRTALKQRGDVVFERPATYMFEVGRFRPETMAFPPGVTVKDFTWAGAAGFPNPVPNAQPQRFPTVIQIVPAPF